MSAVLSVSNLRKVFPPPNRGAKEFVAVDGVSFELAEGEILGLLGPNGAGKSTTINMLLGILSPTAGTITYGDRDLLTHRQQIMGEVAFASTYIKMPWRLTVWENLTVYGLLYGLTHAEFNHRAKRFLKFFDVLSQKDKTMNQLSAGQMTRVMLAKAFIPYPKIVLLDEPTASLDPDIAHEVRAFVLEQQREYQTSILYTSHNMNEVSEVCDRVVFLRRGRILAIDTPDNLAASVSVSRMRLQVRDGLKRTKRFASELGFTAEIKGREIEITLDEQKIASFLNQLARENISYTQIAIAKPTLEDYFLNHSLEANPKKKSAPRRDKSASTSTKKGKS